MKIERGYAQHVGSRQEQQDAGLLLSDAGKGEELVVVADGMGGHAGGSIASAQLAETARRLWAEHKKSPLEPKRLLERIIREGHEAINRAGAEKGLTPRSTCAMLYIKDGTAHWAHVGDSRIYRLRDGQVMRLTRDHSVVQMLVDLGKVSEEEMGTHPDQNRLTQSLGGDASPLPDFGNDTIKTHDAFLVCSDGLWEMIPQSEMAAALAAKKLGDDGARHLAERAFDRAKPKSDNITVALLRIGGPPAGGPADLDDAPTTRIPDAVRDAAGGAARGTAKRGSGGGLRWGFAAATVVALGAAAAIVYVPREPAKPDSGRPADAKQEPPPLTPPAGEQPRLPPPPEQKPDPPKDAQPAPQPPRQGQPGQPPQSPSQPPGEPPGRAKPPDTPPRDANRPSGPPSWARRPQQQ
jgi:serine/threonine protein phosphatase PrpC